MRPANPEALMVDREMPNNVAIESLRAVDLSSLLDSQLTALCKLKVLKSQEDFGGNFAESVAEWRANAGPSVLGLWFTKHNNSPVGIVVLKRPQASPD